jgi:hypothetical protein
VRFRLAASSPADDAEEHEYEGSPQKRLVVHLVARHASAETVAEFTTRDTVSRPSAVAGRAKLPWTRRERQVGGKLGRGP